MVEPYEGTCYSWTQSEILTNFTSADNILLDLHNSPDHTPPYPIMLINANYEIYFRGPRRHRCKLLKNFRMQMFIT